MKEVLIWDLDFLDIPLQDLPDSNCFIVCHDPQRRINHITWAVLDRDRPTDDQALGLFWDKQTAIDYAYMLSEQESLVNQF